MQTTKRLTVLADKGDLDACFEIGYRMAFGRGFSKARPWKQIFTFWRTAAEGGHIRAMFYLATCYDYAQGTKQNLRLAFDWYLKAAKAGHRDSQYNVGFFYGTGELFRRNYKKKAYWYELAAKAGLIDAQRDLGYSYF